MKIGIKNDDIEFVDWDFAFHQYQKRFGFKLNLIFKKHYPVNE